MSSGGTGGGGIVLARKKTDGTTSYASLTDDHLQHIIDNVKDDEIKSRLTELRGDDE